MSYSIQGKRIRITRGDTLVAEVGIANPDGTPYEMQAGDFARFKVTDVPGGAVLIVKDVSSGTAGNATVYLSAPAEFQAETDWHPSTSDQNILAGKILSGTQHIKAVTMTNLDAGNIKDGVTVKIGDSTDDDCVASITGTYTGGGSSVKTATGTFTGNGTRTIDVACTFEPDIVYFTSNPGTTASSGTVAAIIVRDMMTATRYRNNSTTNSHYAIPDIANLNTSGSSYSWRATYANSKVTLYCYSNNARGLLTNGRTYSYTFIKWT